MRLPVFHLYQAVQLCLHQTGVYGSIGKEMAFGGVIWRGFVSCIVYRPLVIGCEGVTAASFCIFLHCLDGLAWGFGNPDDLK